MDYSDATAATSFSQAIRGSELVLYSGGDGVGTGFFFRHAVSQGCLDIIDHQSNPFVYIVITTQGQVLGAATPAPGLHHQQEKYKAK